jgi:leucyl-tRNA synthetase
MLDFHKVEAKWQKEWDKNKLFKSKENSKKKKFYNLEMFPYPSGSGLHMGHALNYTIGDIYARFKRMDNFNVLYPMGYDAFGLPAENAAIKAGEHPMKYTESSMNNFIKQQKAMGLSYDWDRKVVTCQPEYYRWNQYFFLKFYEKGLIYRKKSAVNWCPKCTTVLANEQVHAGKCWRHEDTDVEIKQLEQWFIKTTDYSDELLDFLPKLNWPDRIKTMQENWIGKSFGTEINFKINGKDWPIFTTRPDTIYGVTFLVVAAQHPRINELVKKEHRKDVETFSKKVKSVSEKDNSDLEKEGVFTGSYAVHPLTGEEVPVYAGNFVVADYGAGMVMAVPAHDQRDFEFAKKYNIQIRIVIQPKDKKLNGITKAYTQPGVLTDSKEFTGMDSEQAKAKITELLTKKKLGKKVTQYKFRDWLVSRQRYWGTPIPMIYCEKCGVVPVPEKDLPVKLPEKVKFGKGNPLESNDAFVKVKCPKCKSNARRETDTMDTFFDSSWYYLRFCSPQEDKAPFNPKSIAHWMPVDQYIGGAEHACMHLIYARFFTKALRDLKFVNFDEPFTSLFNQGMMHGNDGNKMSKSLGNVINPLDMIEQYSADALRFNLMSLSSPDKDSIWNDSILESSQKWMNKLVTYFETVKVGKSSEKIQSKVHQTIQEVTEEINDFKYNLAIIKIRKLLEDFEKEEQVSKEDLGNLLKLLHPISPHITEELWHNLGNKTFISTESWPKADSKRIKLEIEIAETLIQNTKEDISYVKNLLKLNQIREVTIIISPQWKYELFEKVINLLKKEDNPSNIIKEIMKTDLKKYGQETIKVITKIIEKRPEFVLKKEKEFKIFKENKEQLEKEFNCKIKLEEADSFKHEKSKNAMPGKPAIILQ